MNPTTLQDYCRVRTLYSQSSAPYLLVEFSTLPPRSSSMVTTDGHRCGYCKGSPRACWVRGPSRAGSQPLCFGLFCQFFIAFRAATVYFTASRWVTFLLEHAATSGVLYGIAVYFHESRCGAALWSYKISVFFQDDGHWHSHTHLLCRAAHRDHSAALLNELRTGSCTRQTKLDQAHEAEQEWMKLF
jgi:hypothetical protein